MIGTSAMLSSTDTCSYMCNEHMMVNIMRKTNDASHMNDMYRSNDGLKKSDLKQIIILRQIK